MFEKIRRVALYEEPGGRLILHREGSPIAFALADWVPGGFAADAAQLAEGEPGSEWRPGGGQRVTILDLNQLPWDRWPDRAGELVAMWEDGRAWLTERSRSAGNETAHEPSWQARRYVGPSSMRDPIGPP